MKKSILVLALGLCTTFNSAYADTYDAVRTGEGYQFSNAPSGGASFNDYIGFTTDGLQSIVASISGTGETSFSFTGFNLLDSEKNLVAAGKVFNSDIQIALGSLKSTQDGKFYLEVLGSSTGGTAGYNGTITLAAAVPEPETYALMLSGLGIIGLLGRRKMRQTA